MYELLKGLHNILRWVVVLGGLYALFTAFRGLFSRAAWTAGDQRAGLIFTSSLNLQLVVGLLLYFVSPLIQGALQNMSAAMGNDKLRFFAVEHATIMVLAVIAAQLGYSLAKRADSDRAKFVRASVGYTVAALLVAYAIPWWRPLLPGL